MPTLCGIFVDFLFEIWLLGGFQIDNSILQNGLNFVNWKCQEVVEILHNFTYWHIKSSKIDTAL